MRYVESVRTLRHSQAVRIGSYSHPNAYKPILSELNAIRLLAVEPMRVISGSTDSGKNTRFLTSDYSAQDYTNIRQKQIKRSTWKLSPHCDQRQH